MRVLITGATGFAGVHLAQRLAGLGHTLAGTRYPGAGRTDLRSSPEQVAIHEVDIVDREVLTDAVARSAPDAIFHLAAFSNPESSWADARRALETNIIGAHNLLQAALETGRKPRVLLVGSSQQYGSVAEEDQPIEEGQPQRPLTPYGVSKTAQEVLGLRFFLAEGLPVFLVRSFNHTGPGQESSYVCSSFARQVAEIEKGLRPARILVGNLSARRDFSDVRDVVHAYSLVLERGEPGEPYNVCRGEAVTIQHILDTLLDLTESKVVVEVDESRYHALDTPLLMGDNRRLKAGLKWEPELGLRQTLSDLLGFWRERFE